MARLFRSIIAMGLTGITSSTLADASSTVSPTASSPASTSSSIEVDVIFPISNATYNITQSLPIVFTLQNLTSAASIAPFTFVWDIMPYGKVGETLQPGGVINDAWSITFTATNTTTEPYILVNQTNVQKWQFGPWYPDGSVYALQWGINWDASVKACDPDPIGATGQLLFKININSPEPDLKNLTGQCPQLGSVFDIDMTTNNSSCSAVISSSGAGNPCAVTVDDAMVASISSVVQSLITASATAASTSTAATALPTLHNIAVSSDVPLRQVIGALVLPIFLSLLRFN